MNEQHLRPVPGGYGDNLVSAELQASACAGRVVAQHDVHDGEQLLDALVLPQVLPALYQEGVVPLVVPTDDQTLGATDGRHHLYLQDACRRQVTTGHLNVLRFSVDVGEMPTLSSKPVIFAWYSGSGLDLPSYCPAFKKGGLSFTKYAFHI